jgi:hypothetical protein
MESSLTINEDLPTKKSRLTSSASAILVNKSMNANICVPPHSKGILIVEYSKELGFSYGISKIDYNVYINIKNGWICVGDPLKTGEAVEFIKNCIAVISDTGKFTFLWLKFRNFSFITMRTNNRSMQVLHNCSHLSLF